MKYKFLKLRVLLIIIFSISIQKAVTQISLLQFSSETIRREQQKVVQALTNWPTALLKAALAIGFLTMIVIEIIKVRIRLFFNENKVITWLDCRHALISDNIFSRWYRKYKRGLRVIIRFFISYNIGKLRRPILEDLILLSSGGDRESFFKLPIENLCGQISVAVQTVLDSPQIYHDLLNALLGKSKGKPDVEHDLRTLTQYYNNLNTENPSYFEARNRISNHIQRNIDALQISTTFSWKRLIRLYSSIVSFVIAYLGISLFVDSIHLVTKTVIILFFSLLGGFFASLFRDIISLIERIKNENK